MGEVKKIIIIFIILIILGLIYIYFFVAPADPSIYFSGNSESYNIEGKKSDVEFKANSIYFNQNITVFRYAKNISVENWNGEIYLLNDSDYHIQVNFKENHLILLKNVYVSIYFDNLTIKSNSKINVEGFRSEDYCERIIRSKGKVDIYYSAVNSISINGDDIKDFKTISFEMGDISYIDLIHGKIIIEGYDVSEFNIRSQILEYFSLGRSEGILTIEDQLYNIKNTETIDIILNSKNPSSCEIQDIKIKFNGKAYSARLNGNDLIKSKISYWFDQEPEKINALAAIILAIITGCYVIITKEILKQTKVSVKQSEASVKQTEKIIEQTKTEKRFDNNEKLLMYVYSPMEVILTKFKLELEYILQSAEPHEIPSGYNSLFKEMNDDLLEIKKNYGYLFDHDLIQLHDKVWKLWKQYLNSDDLGKKRIYETLNSRINGLHVLITDKINDAKEKRNEINQSLYS